MRLTFADVPMADDAPLPDFKNPPVIEVSVGYLFSGLQNYTSLRAASFHTDLKDEYPIVEEHPPLGPTFETFGSVDAGSAQIRFELMEGAVRPRFFFVSQDQAELVQLQGDRIHYNWRKTTSEAGYPRFPQIRERFIRAWSKLQSWAQKEELGQPSVTQCEVVYVNRIPLLDSGDKPCGLSSIFHWLTGLPGITEDGAFQYRQRLNDEAGQPVARLICSLNYGTGSDGKREARLMLTVRGRPLEADEDAFAKFLEEGRKIIVRTFAILTSNEAHKIWERVA
jgi:uncharacterized protein (TIGR04255 family)